ECPRYFRCPQCRKYQHHRCRQQLRQWRAHPRRRQHRPSRSFRPMRELRPNPSRPPSRGCPPRFLPRKLRTPAQTEKPGQPKDASYLSSSASQASLVHSLVAIPLTGPFDTLDEVVHEHVVVVVENLKPSTVVPHGSWHSSWRR